MLDKLTRSFFKLRSEVDALKQDVHKVKTFRTVAKDGVDGKDGISPDVNAVAEMAARLVPVPANGKDGISPTAQAVANKMPAPANGRPGRDGKDGTSITDVKLNSDNEIIVYLDNKRKKIGKINLSKIVSVFAGGGGRPQGQPKAPSDTFSVGTGGQWVDSIVTVTASLYRWDAETTAGDPGIQQIRFNHSDISLATEIYINASTLAGVNSEYLISKIISGDSLSVQRYGVPLSNAQMTATGSAVDNGGWFTIPMIVESNGSGFIAGDRVVLDFYATGRHKNTLIDSIDQSFTNADYDVSPQNKFDENITVPYTDSKITFSFEARSSTINRSVVVGLFVNDTLIDSEFEMEPKDESNNPYPCKVFNYTLQPGANNFKVKFGRRGGAGGSFVALKNVRIFVEPI